MEALQNSKITDERDSLLSSIISSGGCFYMRGRRQTEALCYTSDFFIFSDRDETFRLQVLDLWVECTSFIVCNLSVPAEVRVCSAPKLSTYSPIVFVQFSLGSG